VSKYDLKSKSNHYLESDFKSKANHHLKSECKSKSNHIKIINMELYNFFSQTIISNTSSRTKKSLNLRRAGEYITLQKNSVAPVCHAENMSNSARRPMSSYFIFGGTKNSKSQIKSQILNMISSQIK
jgi:ABC-type oligopeptide transport system substrate-binding subunit